MSLTVAELNTLKYIAGTLVGFFGLLAVIFRFLEAKNPKNLQKFQQWCKDKWQAIHDTGLLELPRKLIHWVVQLKTDLNTAVTLFSKSKKAFTFFILGAPAILAIEVHSIWGLPYTLLPVLALLVNGLSSIDKHFDTRSGLPHPTARILKSLLRVIGGRWATVLAKMIPLLALPFLTLFVATQVYDLFDGWALFMVTLPLLWVGLSLLSAPFEKYLFRNWIEQPKQYDLISVILIPLGFSFSLTFLALLIGKITVPDVWIPQTLQMLMVNALMDGLTMVFTFIILEKALKSVRWYAIPIAITLDTILAATLACLSLYLGLVFTEHSLSVSETVRVLFALNPDGTAWELGPYFWVMHTTFLPTIFYLALILVAYIGKALLSVVHRFFGMAKENDNPLKLTSALCGLIAGFWLFVHYLIPSGN